MFNVKYLNLKEWSRQDEIGLIDWPCGTGKTYESIHTLPKALDIESGKTLLVSPRIVIKEQTLKQYSDFVEELKQESAFEENNKIQVATVHAIGSRYRLKTSVQTPHLVIIDEFHTLFSEHVFAVDLLYFQQQLAEWVNNPKVTVIALTATTTLPLQFVNSCPFDGMNWLYRMFRTFKIRRISEDKEPAYKVKNATVETSKSLETILRQCPASESRKQLVFVKGKIERLMNLAACDSCASWLCSPTSNSRINGVRACDLMNWEHYQSIVKGQMPQGINRVYLSSAYREGLNVKDADVQEIVIEGCTDIDIVQSLGRVRHSVESLIIVIDKRKFAGTDSKVKKALELLKSDNLEPYYQLQKEQEKESFDGVKAPILVYKDLESGELRFNFLALCFWLYEQYSIWCATQNEASEIWFSAARLTPKLPYFEKMIAKYCMNPIRFDSYSYIRPNSIDSENQERIDSFNWSDYSGFELFDNSAKEFSKLLGLRNKDYSTMSISGIYKHYPQYFKSKKILRRDGKRKTVYIIA